MTERKDRTFFFCIGGPKSGTTLLARLLDQHPNIACIWESYGFNPRSPASIFNPDSDKSRKHGFREEDVRHWSEIWARQPQLAIRRLVRKITGRTVLAANPFRITMSEAFEDFAERCHATVVGDKWPMYIDYISQLQKAFPHAKYIYNVRDPRGLWNSAQRFKGRKRGDELLALQLKRDRLIEPFQMQDNFLTVRYEDLILQSETTLTKLYNFLGCDRHQQHSDYDPSQDPYPGRWDWIPESTQRIEPWHAVKWQELIPQNKIRYLTEQSLPFIQKYGYAET